MTRATQSGSGAEGHAAPSIRWPPPGLERLQGDLVRVAIRGALGGGILVLPLLFVLGRDLGFATLGPFADAWWVTLVLAIVGLAFAADTLVRTMTLMRRVSKALEQGYDFDTIRMVVADGDRDMGFLITGSRHFSEIDEKEREAIGALRVFSVTLYALAGVWLPNALAVCILLGARGLISSTALWMTTALPALALYAFGAVAGTLAQSRVRSARRLWHRRPWAADLASDEADAWREEVAARGAERRPGRDQRSLGSVLRPGAVLMAVLAGLVAVPILTLVPTAAVGPILAQLVAPGYDDVNSRAAAVEALRTYRVPSDGALTPQEAGQLLHDLSYAGSDRDPTRGERPPSRRIAEPWLPELDETNPTGVHPFDWPERLFGVLADGATAEQRAFLEELADHPARADLSRLARAEAIDLASARFELPLPPDLTIAEMPIPWYSELRNGAYSHLAAAGLALVEGRPAEARELVAELISIGFLLGDWGPSLMDNLTGYWLIERGADALSALFEASGQTGGADRLAALVAATDAAVSRARFRYPEGAEAWVRSLPSMVSDSSVARGLRWEVFIGITTLTPCINMQRLVFGPDQEYWDFVNDAYDHLVAWPSEDGLFERARSGWFGSAAGDGATVVGRFLSVSMRTGEGTCGEMIRQLEAQEALF